MQSFELSAESRTDMGKGASRRLRRTGKVPGIMYGANKEATMISLKHDDLVHQLEHEAFFSHILTIKLDGKSEKVVLKDLQRHPYKANLLHIDFLRVSESEELTMRIPLHFINEDKCPGVKTGGGVVSHIMTELEIICLPKNLPEYIEVDLITLEVGDSIHLGELKMPEGVVIAALEHGGDPSQPVVSVHVPRVVEEPEEVEAAEEGAEAAEQAAAAAEGESKDEENK